MGEMIGRPSALFIVSILAFFRRTGLYMSGHEYLSVLQCLA